MITVSEIVTVSVIFMNKVSQTTIGLVVVGLSFSGLFEPLKEQLLKRISDIIKYFNLFDLLGLKNYRPSLYFQ